VHAGRRDGEDLRGGAMLWNGGAKPYAVPFPRLAWYVLYSAGWESKASAINASVYDLETAVLNTSVYEIETATINVFVNESETAVIIASVNELETAVINAAVTN
jgi:hypothetical protein